jgi:excisionase family DNA binding protein
MLLRLEEVANRLGISYQLARALVLDGAMPSVKVGPRGVRVHEEELQKYIQVHPVTSPVYKKEAL